MTPGRARHGRHSSPGRRPRYEAVVRAVLGIGVLGWTVFFLALFAGLTVLYRGAPAVAVVVVVVVSAAVALGITVRGARRDAAAAERRPGASFGRAVLWFLAVAAVLLVPTVIVDAAIDLLSP